MEILRKGAQFLKGKEIISTVDAPTCGDCITERFFCLQLLRTSFIKANMVAREPMTRNHININGCTLNGRGKTETDIICQRAHHNKSIAAVDRPEKKRIFIGAANMLSFSRDAFLKDSVPKVDSLFKPGMSDSENNILVQQTNKSHHCTATLYQPDK